MTEHSSLGASSAKRWMTCAGSFALCEVAGPSPPSVYAVAGTVAHYLAERCLTTPEFVPELADGERHQVQGHEVTITPEMIATVHVYLETIRRRRQPGCIVQHETRVSLMGWWRGEAPPPVELFGTADTWIYNPWTQRLAVIDFKYGSGVYVGVQDNPQLLYYAAGVLLRLFQLGHPVRDVEIVVVQPRAKNQEPVRGETIDALDLRLWIDNQLKPAVQRVQDPAAELVTGSHCRFCSARPDCPAHVNKAQIAARDEFDVVPALSCLSV